MTLTKARQLLAVQVSFGGGYNRNAARLILAEVAREHGQDAADALTGDGRRSLRHPACRISGAESAKDLPNRSNSPRMIFCV
jgi:hypothetical protein